MILFDRIILKQLKSIKELSIIFNVSYAAISAIKYNRTYKNITLDDDIVYSI